MESGSVSATYIFFFILKSSISSGVKELEVGMHKGPLNLPFDQGIENFGYLKVIFFVLGWAFFRAISFCFVLSWKGLLKNLGYIFKKNVPVTFGICLGPNK